MSLFAPPELPPEAHTFDATEFGNYTPCGYDPCRIAGSARGIAVKHLAAEGWRKPDIRTSTMFTIRDKHGQVLGYSHLPSESAAQTLKERKLVFRPATVVPRACA